MKMFSILILTTLFFGAFYQEIFRARVLSIKKYRGAVGIGVKRVIQRDTISIISYSTDFYDGDTVANNIGASSIKRIHLGGVYDFLILKPKRFRIDNFTHSMMIVIGKDTIWKGYDTEKAPYFARNCRGVFISDAGVVK